MSDRSLLKEFYNQTEEDLQSEDDSDFVPDESDSEDNVENEEDEEKEERQERGEEEEEEEEKKEKPTTSKKRAVEATMEDPKSKKSRIDAIWADMNKPSSPEPKKREEMVKLETKKEKSAVTAASAKEKISEEPPRQKKQSSSIVRPKSSLSSLVSQYNIKVPKMNTLDKSKLDWQKYVDREGIRDDLKYKNKDGYMEKVEFLQRVDDRRLNQLKAGQKASKKSEPK